MKDETGVGNISDSRRAWCGELHKTVQAEMDAPHVKMEGQVIPFSWQDLGGSSLRI